MLTWLGAPTEENGVVERRFEVTRAGQAVPGVLWRSSAATEAGPLVLLGHGGSQHKTAAGMLGLRDAYTGRLGIATAAIDGPVHGDRGGVSSQEDPRLAEALSDARTYDSMVADWSATIDALVDEGSADPRRIAYAGLSMGTVFGLPLVAAEPRIRVAALGLCGLSGPFTKKMFLDRLRADAPRVTCPVTFHVQWNDQLFDRDGAFELFDLIGSSDKRLQAAPGLHGQVPEDSRVRLREAIRIGLESGER